MYQSRYQSNAYSAPSYYSQEPFYEPQYAPLQPQYASSKQTARLVTPRPVPARQLSLAPEDSISQVGGETGRYADDDWLQHDPYATSYGHGDEALTHPYHSQPLDSGLNAPYGEELTRAGSHDPLVANAVPPGGSRASFAGSRFSGHKYEPLDEKGLGDAEYPPQLLADSVRQSTWDEDYKRPPWWRRQIRDPTPLDRRIEQYRKGIGVQDRPYLCWVICLACIIAFICECANNWKAQGSPIEIHPTFNWLIGPSSSVMINSGARFDPCMKTLPGITNLPFACPNNTANPITSLCPLADVCGFGGFGADGPDQAFRFVLPIFLHAGIIHIVYYGLAYIHNDLLIAAQLVNMVVQLVSSAQVEKEMGALRFFFVYFSAGIFGFVLGGNFALEGQPSVGASGAIFGTHAAVFVDLVSHWDLEQHPKRRLLFLVAEILVGIGLGYVPGVDNFSHLGGFAMGLLACIVLYPSLHRSRRHRMVVYGLRLLALPLIVIAFVLLVRNFYTSDPNQLCEWCRYLSCFPTDNNNHCQGSGLAVTTVNRRKEL